MHRHALVQHGRHEALEDLRVSAAAVEQRRGPALQLVDAGHLVAEVRDRAPLPRQEA